ncbi:MAG: DUF4302 domain-containing protein [Bacteroidales bacterium]|nr:DUF4302 domain-containing protein [Bacteroidales bacterium]
MKKICLIVLVFPLFLQSCLKYEEDLFDKNATERIMEALAQADQVLRGATNGWIMSYYPGIAPEEWGGYTLLMKFEAENKVTISSLYGIGKTDSTEVSMYELLAETGPLLSFNTLNPLMHYFSDPRNPDGINDGAGNVGMGGDYEFIVISAATDKVVLKSKKRGHTIIMTPFTGAASWGDYLTQIKDLETKMFKYTYMYVDGTDTAWVTARPRYRKQTFKYTDKAGENQTFDVAFVSDLNGIVFYEPFELFDKTIARMDFVDDGEDGWFNASSGGKLVPTVTPLTTFFLYEDWYFKYNSDDIGTYGFSRWTAFRNGLASTGRELIFACLSQYSSDAWGFSFATNLGTGSVEFDYTVEADDRVYLEFAGWIRGQECIDLWEQPNGAWFIPVIATFHEATFTITTDNPKDPTWLRITEDGYAANSYRLYKEYTPYPFRP